MRMICGLIAVLVVVLFSGVCSAGQGLLAGKVIVLDPGHGGNNDGAVHFGVRRPTSIWRWVSSSAINSPPSGPR